MKDQQPNAAGPPMNNTISEFIFKMLRALNED